MMTKQDFIALADVIKEQNKRGAIVTGDYFSLKHLDIIADFCYQQNPRFNRERWLDYIAGKCGKNGGKVNEGKNMSYMLEQYKEGIRFAIKTIKRGIEQGLEPGVAIDCLEEALNETEESLGDK